MQSGDARVGMAKLGRPGWLDYPLGEAAGGVSDLLSNFDGLPQSF